MYVVLLLFPLSFVDYTKKNCVYFEYARCKISAVLTLDMSQAIFNRKIFYTFLIDKILNSIVKYGLTEFQ